MTRGFFSHFLLRISWIIVFKWNNNAIRPLRELETTETLRDPINCVIYWKGTRNGSRLTDWQVPFCRVRKWPSIISGASSSLYFTVGESVVALYSSLYYKIPSFLRDFDGILNEGKLYLNLIKQRKSAVRVQVNDTHLLFNFFSFFLFMTLLLSRASFISWFWGASIRTAPIGWTCLTDRPLPTFVFYNFPSAFGL